MAASRRQSTFELLTGLHPSLALRPLELGELVTTKGRAGAGQPEISGSVEKIERGMVLVRRANGELRWRSLRNVRRI